MARTLQPYRVLAGPNRAGRHDDHRVPRDVRLKDTEGQMKRMKTLAMALLMPVLMTACEDDDGPFETNDDLVGNFQASNFGFTGTANTSLARDFDREGATFTVSLRNNGTFESRFTEQGASPVVRTGTFTTQGNEVVLGNRSLITGAQDNVEQRFIFERQNNNLTLRSAGDTRFDFNRDNTFSSDETARFEADLTTF